MTSLGFRPFLDGYHDASLQLQAQVYRRSEALFAEAERRRDAIATLDQLRAHQAYLRETTLAAIGGLPPDDTPLSPEHVGARRGDGFEVEKLIYQSLPGVHCTANLYLPRGLGAKTGAVLFLCGHTEPAKAYPFYQAVCQRLARNGLVALALDPIGQGERKSYLDADGRELVRWGVPEHTYAGVQCWWQGHSIGRYFVHDARRAIDYLLTRPEVDPARIGVTGNSGGGTQATWLMLLEERLAAAAPATFLMARRDYMWTGQAQDAEQIIPGGTLAGIDHEDFLLAMAPRPVLVLAADYDYFPVGATIRTVERARRVYELLGASADLELAHTPGLHEYHPALARAATAFFVRHLGAGRDAALDDAEPRPLEPAELNCTRSGQVLLDRPDTRRVFDLNLEAFQERERRDDRAWLRQVVHRHRQPCPFYPRWLPGPVVEGAKVLHGYWWSEADICGAGVLVVPEGRPYRELVVALFDRGTAEIDERRDWVLGRIRDGPAAVLALDVRGTGALAPHQLNAHPMDAFYGTIYKLATDLLWLDDSLAAGRVYDVLRAFALAREDHEIDLGGRPIRLFGAGRGAFLARLAAALDSGVDGVELEDAPMSPAGVVADRLYPEGAEWQCLIPGLALTAP
ncbi:MAG TPA: acetylxylan esterase [Chloroflexota bacterium]|nr:acetylxylan esterase [Chloroflexota bacterium]